MQNKYMDQNKYQKWLRKHQNDTEAEKAAYRKKLRRRKMEEEGIDSDDLKYGDDYKKW